jgi:predicted DNA-binding transcriptional regulator YafY
VRHEKAELLLRIAFDMQAMPEGLTLENIATGYGEGRLSRRTAERLRDAVARLFPAHFEEVAPGTLPKRWRLRRSWLHGLSRIDDQSLAALALASQHLREQGFPAEATSLALLRGQLQASLSSLDEAQGADVEALTLLEGTAMRWEDRASLDAEILSTLRRAIRQGRQVMLRFRYARSGVRRMLQLHPYGLLYGKQHHLVAGREGDGAPRLFALAGIESLTLLSEPLRRPAHFSLATFAEATQEPQEDDDGSRADRQDAKAGVAAKN